MGHDKKYLEIISQRFGYHSRYQPETPLSARELKLILRAITKMLLNNLCITYSNSLFNAFEVQKCKQNIGLM